MCEKGVCVCVKNVCVGSVCVVCKRAGKVTLCPSALGFPSEIRGMLMGVFSTYDYIQFWYKSVKQQVSPWLCGTF